MWHGIGGRPVEGITGNDFAMESGALTRRATCKLYEVVLKAKRSVNARRSKSVTRDVGHDSAGIRNNAVVPQWEVRSGKTNKVAAKVI